MKIIQKSVPLSEELMISPSLADSLFLDIETTGFSAQAHPVYLIGCCHPEGSELHLCQWLAETPAEEPLILREAGTYAASFSRLVTFNGDTFDLPFLKKRCEVRSLPGLFWNRIPETVECTDLFRLIRPLKSFLGLPDSRQKTVEAFLGIMREDRYSGGDLVRVYKEYAQHPDPEAEHLLLLHNEEDVLAMPELLPVLAYPDFLAGRFSVLEILAAEEAGPPAGEETAGSPDSARDSAASGVSAGSGVSALALTLRVDLLFPRPVLFSRGDFRVFLYNDTVRLTVPTFTGTLRHYFPNYREYWYLPAEDLAIHKSVAAFVEKDHRIKCTPETACVKKEGSFLRIPGKAPVSVPVFRNSSTSEPWILQTDCPEGTRFWDEFLRALLQ